MVGRTSWWLAILGVAGVCGGAELTFTGSGSHSTASAWTGGTLPTASDSAKVLGAMTINGAGAVLNADRVTVGGTNLTSMGSVSVGNGGVLNTRCLARGRVGAFAFDGGALGVPGTGEILAKYFDGVDEISVGAGGLVFDTGANTVYAGDIPLSEESAGTAVVTKKGPGTLGLVRAPRAGVFKVAEGAVVLAGSRPDATKNLAHRWSFNGDCRDSVEGRYAQLYKASGPQATGTEPAPVYSYDDVVFTADRAAVQLAGGAGADFIGLGYSALPFEGPVTIEMWTTLDRHVAGEAAIAIGSSQSNGLVLNFTKSGENAGDAATLGILGDRGSEGDVATFEPGVEYYVAIVIVPAPDGGSVVTVYTRDVRTRAGAGSYAVKTAWKVGDLTQNGAWLGWSWWNNPVAKAAYDELRIWNAAFTEGDVDRDVALGPDRLPDEIPDVDDNVYPAVITQELKGRNFMAHRWTFDGTLEDSVGGFTAVPHGSWQFSGDAKQIDMAGQGKGASGTDGNYIDLGANLLPTTGPVTIEMWSTLRGRQTWEKAISIGSAATDSLLFTYTSGRNENDGYPSFYLTSGGSVSWGNVGTFEMYPIDGECYLAIVLNPRAGGGTDVAVRLWEVQSRRLLGAYLNSTSWTMSQMVQSYARLNCSSFWSDPFPDSSYNEFRVWNVGFSERQQRLDLELGPDEPPVLMRPKKTTPVNLDVAAGAVVDLSGTSLEPFTVSGGGRVQNGNLEVTGVLSPGGDGAVGTLTLDAGVKVTGTIRLDVGDLVLCTGDVDLAEASVEVLDRGSIHGSYTLLKTTGGVVRGPLKGDNLAGTGKVVKVSEDRVFIQAAALVIFLQ